MPLTLYEQLGGENKLRAIIDTFVDQVTTDLLIGFFFKDTNIKRLKELEYQHAASFLGAPGVIYRGRDLHEVHHQRRILGGQFARRQFILKQVLQSMQVPGHIQEAWLQHAESLRALIVAST